jgi:hypothetical protein
MPFLPDHQAAILANPGAQSQSRPLLAPLLQKSLLRAAIHPNVDESVRGYGSVTYKPRQGRNAATVVCSPLP